MTKPSKADLLLHPVRFRIVQCLIGGRNRTVQEIGAELPDIPQATLYRQIKKLIDAGLIQVVNQQQVRGTVEKTLALRTASPVSNEELQAMSRDEHMHTFMMFIASLIDDYDRYLQREQINLVEDGISFRKATVYLSDEEFAETVQAIRQAIEKAMQHSPNESRRRRVFSNIIMPDETDGERSL